MTKKKKIILSITIILSIVLLASVLLVCLYVIPEHKKNKEREEFIKSYRQSKLEKYTQENNQYADYEVDVAFLGDSLTDCYDVETHYAQYKVVNRGIGGDTTFDLENRLKISAYDLKPKVAVMLIGANNFQTMFDNYERIVAGLKNNLPSTKIVLLSLTAMSGSWGKNNELACFNNIKIKQIAEKYSCVFVDLFYPLFDLDSNGLLAEYTIDGGHLTPAGYNVLTAEITPVLESLLP